MAWCSLSLGTLRITFQAKPIGHHSPYSLICLLNSTLNVQYSLPFLYNTYHNYNFVILLLLSLY